MVNLKDNIWLEEFDTEFSIVSTASCMWFGKNMELLLYSSELKDITEKEAKEFVGTVNNTNIFINYKSVTREIGFYNDPLKSLLSACDSKYCLIFKK
jgi:hypothetical protein